MLEQFPDDPDRRRIAELCGLDPDAVLKERDARPMPPPEIEPRLKEALELAVDDAARLGQSDVRPENLLFGLLRCSNDLSLMYFTRVSRMDLDRFRADFGARILPPQDRLNRGDLSAAPDAQAAIQDAVSVATERRRESVGPQHLLYALLRSGHGVAAELLERYGSNAANLLAAMETGL